MTRAPRWLKPINKIYMLLLRRGVSFGAEQPLVLTVRGRRSGKSRSTPITPMAVDAKRYAVAVFRVLKTRREAIRILEEEAA